MKKLFTVLTVIAIVLVIGIVFSSCAASRGGGCRSTHGLVGYGSR